MTLEERKKLLAWAVSKGLISYPDWRIEDHILRGGPRQDSAFDQLPDEDNETSPPVTPLAAGFISNGEG